MRKFELTENHLKLLQNSKIIWNPENFGAPCVNSQKPYGSENFYEDITRIIGMDFNSEMKFKLLDETDFISEISKFEKDTEIIISELQKQEILKLHSETLQALKILISGNHKLGVYVAGDNLDNWIYEIQKIPFYINQTILNFCCPICGNYSESKDTVLICNTCLSTFKILKIKAKTLKVKIIGI